MGNIQALIKREWGYLLGVRPSRKVWLILIVVGVLICQSAFFKIGPNDGAMRDYVYNTIGEKYGFPIFSYVGNGPPPSVKISWQIVSYVEDADKKGGLYTVKFQHMTQNGGQIDRISGQMECHYDTVGKKIALIAFSAAKPN